MVKQICLQLIEDFAKSKTLSSTNVDLVSLCRNNVQVYDFENDLSRLVLFDPKAFNDLKGSKLPVENILYLPFSDAVQNVIIADPTRVWLIYLPKFLESDLLKLLNVQTTYDLVEKQIILLFF